MPGQQEQLVEAIALGLGSSRTVELFWELRWLEEEQSRHALRQRPRAGLGLRRPARAQPDAMAGLT